MKINKLDEQYCNIAKDILLNGSYKITRNGNVYSTFCREMRHDFSEGFPLLTTKQMSLKNVFTELKWFMLGRTDLRFLVERKCNIWNGDAHKNYIRNVKRYIEDAYKDYRMWRYFNLTEEQEESGVTPIQHLINNGIVKADPLEKQIYIPYTEEEFVKKVMEDDKFNEAYGDLGPIYGAQWLNFNGEPKNLSELGEDVYASKQRGFNQIQMILNLLKNDPDSRRIRVTAWNPTVLDDIALPSCHTDFQCYTEDKNGQRELSLMFSCRSQDFFLGTPYNTASYGLLTLILSKIFNYKPKELIHRMGDTHIYEGHLDAIKTQLTNEGFELPKLILKGEFDKIDEYWRENEFDWIGFIEKLEWNKDFELIDYKHNGKIVAPLYT